MPHTTLIINKPDYDANYWVRENGFSTLYQTIGITLGCPGEVAVFAEQKFSHEDPNTRLDLEIVVDSGMYHPESMRAVNTAVALYDAIIAGSWKLPKKWGLWFRHKCTRPDIFITPDTIETWREKVYPG